MQNFWHTHRCQGILYDDESRLIDFHIPLFHSINVVSNILHNTLSSVLFWHLRKIWFECHQPSKPLDIVKVLKTRNQSKLIRKIKIVFFALPSKSFCAD
jgi:hypothetical protein